jgi:hypothetical protein
MPNTAMNGSRNARPWKAVVVALLLCASVLAIVHAALPPFWGVPNLAIKWDALHRDPRPERLVIGSSRIYRQVIPSLMDSVIGHGRTFNAGYAATFPPATYGFCERLLEEDRQPPQEILVELSNYMLYEEANLEDHRYWYYLGPCEGLALVRHALWLPDVTRDKRLGYATRAARATGYSLLGLGLVDHLLAAAADADTLEALGPLGDGGLTLETLARYTPEDTSLLARRASFLADTLAAQRRAIGLRHLYARPSAGRVSRIHLDRLNALLDKAQQRGVRLRFVIPPLWIDRGEDLVALANELPDSSVIALCHPDSFPQFYRPENMFDAGHLNDQGARLFTIELARLLNVQTARQGLPQ